MVAQYYILYIALLPGCVYSTGTGTVISDLTVREGSLLQYGSSIRTLNPYHKLTLTLMLNAVHT